MKAILERGALLKALSHVQSVVERRQTMPILAHVLLRAEDGRLTLAATDLGVEAVESAAAQVETPGGATAPAQTLHEIIRKLPDGAQISLSHDPAAARLEIVAGRSRFELATLPDADFPRMATAEYAARFVMKAGALKRMLDKAKFAMSSDESRYYLNGVYLHLAQAEGGLRRLRAVATDGHRLARIETDPPSGAEAMPARGVILPRKTVTELGKLLEDAEAEVEVSISEDKVRFACGPVVLTSLVVEGDFPDYSRVIPRHNDKRLHADPKLLAAAVDRVATVATDKTNAVKLTLEEDKLTLSVISPDSGSAAEELLVGYGAAPLEIGFNARYLLDILGQIEKGDAAFFLADPNAPMLARDGEDESALYVVMPMRV
ncbi:DNA polymerase III subunit beta [Neomegalonema sp.]|uniref:DNA polymerase III subunit beta n=1 Tax=Neomegalonema sp. TaxID=2039713 RepID=UPI00262F0B88|nr:DNA polymerase III subunit beta [Neomegalonema sp.]MDD2867224.1 DNA polymerase III subunit beta [Neomegalonema sp.]